MRSKLATSARVGTRTTSPPTLRATTPGAVDGRVELIIIVGGTTRSRRSQAGAPRQPAVESVVCGAGRARSRGREVVAVVVRVGAVGEPLDRAAGRVRRRQR